MKRQFLIILTLILSNLTSAQVETPCFGCSAYSNYGIIKKDSAGTYFYATKDSSKIAFIYRQSIYKLFDRNYNLILEGDLGGRCFVDYYKQYGKWTEYFPNGTIKSIGNYYDGNPVGLWKYFYPTGQIKETYSISLIQSDSSFNYCKTGTYQAFYENGQLKVDGFYKAKIDTVRKEKSYYGVKYEKKIVLVREPVSKKFGIWLYFKPNGELEKKEEYNQGDN